MTDAQIKCLTGEGEAEFEPAEKATIAYAEEMTRSPQKVSDAVFAELRKHWNERQIVEITATAALFNSFNRFYSALAVDPTTYPQPLGN